MQNMIKHFLTYGIILKSVGETLITIHEATNGSINGGPAFTSGRQEAETIENSRVERSPEQGAEIGELRKDPSDEIETRSEGRGHQSSLEADAEEESLDLPQLDEILQPQGAGAGVS